MPCGRRSAHGGVARLMSQRLSVWLGLNAALAEPTTKARLADMGGMLLTGSAADWGKLIVNETDKLGKVIRSAGIKEE